MNLRPSGRKGRGTKIDRSASAARNELLSFYMSYLRRFLGALRSYCFGVPRFILDDKTITVLPGTFIDKSSAIGAYTYVGKHCNITRTAIGRYCSIANNVSIGQGEHDVSRVSTSSLFYKNAFDELTKKTCEIGHDVWIGVGAVVLRGVIVGDGAVIGANSVVTRDVPAFGIVVGAPARLLRYRFEQDVIQTIRREGWWRFDIEKASEIVKRLGNDTGRALS